VRAQQLTVKASSPELAMLPELIGPLQKELGVLLRTVGRYEEYRRLVQQIEDNKAMAAGSDRELAELAAAEVPQLEAQAQQLADSLIDDMLQDSSVARDGCIVEIRAGTGGDEAALFARDLMQLYQRLAARVGWTVEMISSSPSELGGFKELAFTLRGDDVYRHMQFESGGHRVQRVPETETKGRVHTSLATVAVLPEVEDVQVEILDKDLRVDTFRSSGAGGQHVNTTDSAVRITHLPTGLVVIQQDERSQHKNKAKAMKLLRSRLYDFYQQKADAERAAERKEQVGTGDRNERIRTYNFPQDRLTDHRLGRNFTLSQVLEGKLEPVQEALMADDRQRRLETI